LRDCQNRIDNLISNYISPANADKDLISDKELKERKASLIKEKAEIEQQLDSLSRRADEWLELTEKTFNFAVYAKKNFTEGDYETKTGILRALGSEFILKDGQINITFRKQYQLIEKSLEMTSAENAMLEPTEFASNKAKTAHLEAVSANWSG